LNVRPIAIASTHDLHLRSAAWVGLREFLKATADFGDEHCQWGRLEARRVSRVMSFLISSSK